MPAYELPTSIQIGQASFNIRNKADYRMVLDCLEALKDMELTANERAYSALIIFYEDFNSIEDIADNVDLADELISGMLTFINLGEKNSNGNTDGHVLIDWMSDSNLICSAINNIIGQDVRSLKYLHWWTFLGYYTAIGECPLSNIVSIRYKIAHNEKLEKYEKKFRQDNPEYFNFDTRSAQQKEADDYIRKLWGGDN